MIRTKTDYKESTIWSIIEQYRMPVTSSARLYQMKPYIMPSCNSIPVSVVSYNFDSYNNEKYSVKKDIRIS